MDSRKVARAYTEIRAPFARAHGRDPGARRQPRAALGEHHGRRAPLVTITQIDPISVAFTLPEQELASLQQALRAGPVPVTATARSGADAFKGKVSFVDNAVDTATGTIRVKAEFANPTGALWPGMYVNVEVAPRTLPNAVVIPTQAVQTGPENRFVYVVGADGKVVAQPITVKLTSKRRFAVVSGIGAGRARRGRGRAEPARGQRCRGSRARAEVPSRRSWGKATRARSKGR